MGMLRLVGCPLSVDWVNGFERGRQWSMVNVEKVWTPAEIRHRYQEGERDFQGLDISDLNDRLSFQGAVLDGSDFSHAFVVADFTRGSLRDCKFVEANVKTCTFDHADLRGCDFSRAAIDAATFRSAQLDRADFLAQGRMATR